ncbi:MAG: PA2779 family protein [Acidobacteria bacterium]|nr:PA2779 family protein [Acidobacteriota bacterium]
MHFELWQSTRLLVGCILITLFALPPSPLAQTHVVSQADIQKELVSATRTRQKNLEKAKQFLSSDAARKSMGSAQMDPERIDAAVSKLSDAELAQLASRADQFEQDFAAGRLSDRDLLLILLGIAALILIIVAVR